MLIPSLSAVLKALGAPEQDHPELAGQLRSRHADVLVQPQWQPWSMSDKELDQAVRDNEKITSVLSALGFGSALAGERVKPRLPGVAGRVGAGGIALGATLGTISDGVNGQIRRLEAEQGRRGLTPTSAR
jgi:hypothetical protein